MLTRHDYGSLLFVQAAIHSQLAQRVIAVDYLRGISMLVIIIDHMRYYSSPLVFFTGRGELWVSAAEAFFFLSGLTLGIVRGRKILIKFRETAMTIWRRSIKLYAAHVIITLLTLGFTYLLIQSNVRFQPPGSTPEWNRAGTLVFNTLTLQYSFGWSDFLRFYAVFLALTPLALKALGSRIWYLVPLISTVAYLSNQLPGIKESSLQGYLVWQVYFFWGLFIADQRLRIIPWFASLSPTLRFFIGWAIIFLTLSSMAISNIMTFMPELLPNLPLGSILSDYKYSIEYWVQNLRSGPARPLVAALWFTAIYLIFQMVRGRLLKYTGWLVSTLGRNSLYVYILQGVLIPVFTVLPLPNQLVINTFTTVALVMIIWIMVQRRFLFGFIPR